MEVLKLTKMEATKFSHFKYLRIPMRHLFSLLLLIVVAGAADAQTGLQIVRNGESVAVSASFTGKSNIDRLTLTPRTLDAIAHLSHLRSLTLWGTDVSDADVTKLLPLKELQSIDLSYTNVTSDVLVTLSELPELVLINLEGCDVADKHLEQFSKLDRLVSLRLAKTKVTGEGLKHLHGLKQLVDLDLSACDISDDGLLAIGDLPHIQLLWLSKTVRYGKDDKSRLTDKCIDYLVSLKTLVDLQIADTRLSDAGLKRLKAALPNAKVSTESSGVLYLDRKKPE